MKDVQLMDWPCSSEHRGLMWCSRLRHQYVACKCCTQHDVESQLCSCESNIAGPNLMTHGATSHWVTSLSTMCIFEMCHFGILVCSIRYIRVISNLMWLAFGRVGRVSFCDSVQERRRGIQHRRSGGAQTTYTSCGSFGNISCNSFHFFSTWRRSIASSVASKLRPDGVLIYSISSYHVISHHHMTKVSSGASSASKSIGDKWVQFVSLAACSTLFSSFQIFGPPSDAQMQVLLMTRGSEVWSNDQNLSVRSERSEKTERFHRMGKPANRAQICTDFQSPELRISRSIRQSLKSCHSMSGVSTSEEEHKLDAKICQDHGSSWPAVEFCLRLVGLFKGDMITLLLDKSWTLQVDGEMQEATGPTERPNTQ